MTFKEVMKKCFGKEKNDRWHAVAMLILYGIFFLVSFIILSITSPDKDNTKWEEPVQIINYSYTYTVTYNNEVEVYLGKKYADKQAFTLVKNGVNSEYNAIGDKIYNVNDDNILNTYFKYLDREKIESLVVLDKCIKDNNTYTCTVDTKELANTFNDTINDDNVIINTFIIEKENNEIKSIKLDLSSYISNLLGEPNTLTVNMSFTDIGTTKDFEVKK